MWDGVKWASNIGSVTAQSMGDVGRNLLHNPLFNVAQRGAGPFAVLTATYTLDRWMLNGSTDTASIRQFAVNDTERAGIGDEAANMMLANTFTGNAAAGAYHEIVQRIEDVRRLAGKTVTLSFWAAASGALKLGINMTQYFGTGGSPSTAVNVLATGNSVTLSGTWTRYTSTIALPGISGKTLGSNSDHSTQIRIAYSSGATANAFFGNIGVQSGTINIWGVQLEVGSVATPLEKPDPQQDAAKCFRFFQSGYVGMSGYVGAGGSASAIFPWSVVMRAAPTLIPVFTTQTNCGSSAINPYGTTNYQVYTVGTAAGNYLLAGTFTASADL